MNDRNTTSGKAPTHAAYHVRDREGGKAFWTHVGSACAHADCKGFNVLVDTVTLHGLIIFRVIIENCDPVFGTFA